MRFLSNFGCKIIFMYSVNFCHQQDSNSLFKGSIGYELLCDLLVQVASYHTSLMPHLHRNLNMFKSSLVLNVVLNCFLY